MDNTSKPLVAKTVTRITELRKTYTSTVGFIPTMGFLHAGHASLIKRAKRENDVVIVSIFVNPTQFGPKEDFQQYPRDTKRDMQLLRSLHVDCIFFPTTRDMYPPEFFTFVEVSHISNVLEGKSRPGHFKGVATVVNKLFNILQPTRAYFGQKDAQQVAIIKKMVTDLNIPVEIVVGDTVREINGLAMSSRNVFLNKKERTEAVVLYKSLLIAQKLFQLGEKSSKKIKHAMKNLICGTSGKIDYISIAKPQTLQEISQIEDVALISLAVRFGNIRLIDNIVIKMKYKR